MPMRRTLILVGVLVGLVGLGWTGQQPPAQEVAAASTPPAGPEASARPCEKQQGQDIASAVIVPKLIEPEGKKPYWGYRIDPKLICVKKTGTIYWFVDARGYPTDYGDEHKAGKFKLGNFKLKNGQQKDPFRGECDEIKEITGTSVFVTKCKLTFAEESEDYLYEITPWKNENKLPTVDPEIAVRG